jgi:hypothetical protein
VQTASDVFRDDSDAPLDLDGARPWLISCDESGIHKSKYYGYGSLWMPWDRRGDFVADIRRIAGNHGMHVGRVDGVPHEFKWSKVSTQKLAFYKALVEYFFGHPRLLFHCIVVRRQFVNVLLHRGGYVQAQQKHFTLLLTNKIARALKSHHRKFRVWVDPLPGGYAKANEVMEIISNHVLNRQFGKVRPVDKVIPHESHDTPSIQLCDVLLGAVMAAWQAEVTAPAKLSLQQCIAEHLGWPDLRADTMPADKKFNIWFLCDPRDRPADVRPRPLRLKSE